MKTKSRTVSSKSSRQLRSATSPGSNPQPTVRTEITPIAPRAAPESAVESVVARMRDLIYRGQIVGGQRLLLEDLAKRFGVSRPVVREALSRLAGDDVVEIEMHRGATVRRLGTTEVAELLRICAVVEGLAAREAAEHIQKPGKLQEFKLEINRVLGLSIVSWFDFWDALVRLQSAIRKVGENQSLARLESRLHSPLLRPLMAYAPPRTELAGEFKAFARAILEAIAASDPDKAELTMRSMLHKSSRDLCEVLVNQQL